MAQNGQLTLALGVCGDTLSGSWNRGRRKWTVNTCGAAFVLARSIACSTPLEQTGTLALHPAESRPLSVPLCVSPLPAALQQPSVSVAQRHPSHFSYAWVVVPWCLPCFGLPSVSAAAPVGSERTLTLHPHPPVGDPHGKWQFTTYFHNFMISVISTSSFLFLVA